jgi:hypothetical protein
MLGRHQRRRGINPGRTALQIDSISPFNERLCLRVLGAANEYGHFMDGSERTEEAPSAPSAPTSAPSAPTSSGAGSEDRRAPVDQASGAAPSAVESIRVDCLMNARYHAAREAFLDAVHRWIMFGVIVFGAGAVVDLLAVDQAATWFKGLLGAGAAILGALDLAFDLSNRARAHSLMKRRYFELLADVAEGRKPVTEAQACLNRYSADEEPAYHALLLASWNAAQEMIYGDGAYEYDISAWDRFWQNVWRFEGKKYPLKRRDRSSASLLSTSTHASSSA